MTDTQVSAIEQLARTFDFGHGVRHSRKVATLSASLFDQLSFLNLIPALMPEDRRLLFAAALAHDIGASPKAFGSIPDRGQMAVPSRVAANHSMIGCHLLRRAIEESYMPRLRELTDRDWSALLYCVLWHEGSSDARIADVPLFEPWRTRPLAGMLRLSEGLDCERRNVVTDIRVIRALSWMRILVKSSRPCDEEVAAAQQKSDILAEALGLRIAVQQIIEEETSTGNTA